jgi:hypothetical protein
VIDHTILFIFSRNLFVVRAGIQQYHRSQDPAISNMSQRFFAGIYRDAADVRAGKEPKPSPVAHCACCRESISNVRQSHTCVCFVQLKRLSESSLFIALPAKVSVIVVDSVKSALGRVKEDLVGNRIKTNVRKLRYGTGSHGSVSMQC